MMKHYPALKWACIGIGLFLLQLVFYSWGFDDGVAQTNPGRFTCHYNKGE